MPAAHAESRTATWQALLIAGALACVTIPAPQGPAHASDRASAEVCAYWLQWSPAQWTERLETLRARWNAIRVTVTDIAEWRARRPSDPRLTILDGRIWKEIKAKRYNARHDRLSDQEAYFLGKMTGRVYASDVAFDKSGQLAESGRGGLRRYLDKAQMNATRYELVRNAMVRVYPECVGDQDRPAAERLAHRARAMWDADLAMR